MPSSPPVSLGILALLCTMTIAESALDAVAMVLLLGSTKQNNVNIN